MENLIHEDLSAKLFEENMELSFFVAVVNSMPFVNKILSYEILSTCCRVYAGIFRKKTHTATEKTVMCSKY